MEDIIFNAMGSEIFCAVDSWSPQLFRYLDRVPALFEAWEQIFSPLRAESELSRLNERAGERVRVSDTLWRVLKFVRHAELVSRGLVMPIRRDSSEATSSASDIENFKFNHTGRENRKPNGARAQEFWKLHDPSQSITLAPGTRLDVGSFPMAWAVDQAAAYLGEVGPAMVDAGSYTVITAPRPIFPRWFVSIENPFRKTEPKRFRPFLTLTHGAVATVQRDARQPPEIKGRSASPPIQPRAFSNATNVVSATVIAPTLFEAAVGAHVAIHLNSSDGWKWIDAHAELAALWILENQTRVYNARMKKFLIRPNTNGISF